MPKMIIFLIQLIPVQQQFEFEEVSNWDYIELKIMYNFDIYSLIDYIMQDAPVGCAIKRSNI